MTEYALIMAAIAVVVYATYVTMGTDISTLVGKVNTDLTAPQALGAIVREKMAAARPCRLRRHLAVTGRCGSIVWLVWDRRLRIKAYFAGSSGRRD